MSNRVLRVSIIESALLGAAKWQQFGASTCAILIGASLGKHAEIAVERAEGLLSKL